MTVWVYEANHWTNLLKYVVQLERKSVSGQPASCTQEDDWADWQPCVHILQIHLSRMALYSYLYIETTNKAKS